jgi:hypothetical protein
MHNKYIRSEKGFGLVSLLITAIFALVAATSMYIAAVYVKAKAKENYHYRKALLALQNEFEQAHYDYLIDGLVNPVVKNVEIDKVNGRPITAQITWTSSVTPDFAVAPYAEYVSLVGTISWEEPLIVNEKYERNRNMAIRLREDFYQRRKTVQTTGSI